MNKKKFKEHLLIICNTTKNFGAFEQQSPQDFSN